MVEGAVTSLEYCRLRGTSSGDNYLHMCTTCAATTTLPENYWPRLVNEAVCEDGEPPCMVVEGQG